MYIAVHNACLNAIAVSFAQTPLARPPFAQAPLACLLACWPPLCTDRISWQTGKTVAAES